jgi:hypothetical protein
VCGSRAWARVRLRHVTPEYATYASSPTSLHRESEQLQNLLSESPYLLRDKMLAVFGCAILLNKEWPNVK